MPKLVGKDVGEVGYGLMGKYNMHLPLSYDKSLM
jgi:hypothetical protein